MKHRVISSDDFSLKDFYPVGESDFRELAQQNAPQPTALKIVRYGKGNLGPLLRDSSIERVTNDTLLFTTARNQSECLVQVCFSMSLGCDG
jgi:hypothetical protein